MEEYFDLYTLQSRTRRGMEELYPDPVWVKAEIASLSVKPNGHCYMEFSQSEGGKLVAKARAVAWNSRYALMDGYFLSMTGSRIAAGMEVLVLVRVTYHEVYGLSLTVEDVNAEFTLGQREKARRETLARLEREGLTGLQKRIPLAGIPYNLAVISSETAAGWGDFRKHLAENPGKYTFNAVLFPALMQGDAAPLSIEAALGSVAASPVSFDAVLILRGGGSGLDLSCFDDYRLASAVALFPLPVFSAIGHDRDVHVLDTVAHMSVKTPTALADFFVERKRMAEDEVDDAVRRLRNAASAALDRAGTALRMLELRLAAADPRNVLQKGYSLVLDDSSVRLSSVSSRKAGDTVRLVFPDGVLVCTVDRVEESPYSKTEMKDGRL